jgi:hypothetical protein
MPGVQHPGLEAEAALAGGRRGGLSVVVTGVLTPLCDTAICGTDTLTSTHESRSSSRAQRGIYSTDFRSRDSRSLARYATS